LNILTVILLQKLVENHFSKSKSCRFSFSKFQASIFKRHTLHCFTLTVYGSSLSLWSHSVAENKCHECGALCKAVLLPGYGASSHTLELQYWPKHILFSALFQIISPHGVIALRLLRPPHYGGFIITLRHTTLGRTPLDKWSARSKDLYLTTHNTLNGQTSMAPVNSNPQSQQSRGRITTGIGHLTPYFQQSPPPGVYIHKHD
jgi:hypothetical protein